MKGASKQMSDDQAYPEHEKLHKVKDQSQTIGEFLEWLRHDKGVALCELNLRVGEYLPVYQPTNEILADYFKIDLGVIEEEKLKMMDAIRAAAPCD